MVSLTTFRPDPLRMTILPNSAAMGYASPPCPWARGWNRAPATTAPSTPPLSLSVNAMIWSNGPRQINLASPVEIGHQSSLREPTGW